ncbi:MAG: helicase-related protein, partial [Thermotogota bacterium]|nr:helicase-related protein [Thermotogota bacterium]
IRQESITFATITFQNYFKLYEKVSGMTGTAATEESEFISMYNTPVAVVPTNREVVRGDKEDLIYKSREEKDEAIIEEIVRRYEKGQPVLVGTTSIEKSEQLSNLLQKKGVAHEVLNAKYHEREAEIVAKAGQAKTVTIATNMAGRGTDIKLGEGVVDLGGLFVLGTERHESRRIDNQLVGRSGRQGDPGESRFYLSTEDDLLRLFGGERMQSIMTTLKIERGQPIEHPLLSRIISSSQKKIEGIHFEIRKRLFELDSVMDQQRSAIYAHRDWVLKGEELDSNISEIIRDVVERRLDGLQEMPSREEIRNSFAFLPPDSLARLSESKTVQELKESAIKSLEDTYQEKKKSFGEEFPQVMKYIMLRMIDERWRRHLEAVDHLKDSVGLRAYGQKDPVVEFKKESYELFQQLTDSLYDDIASAIVRIVKVDSDKAQQKADKEFKNLQAVHSEFGTADKKSDSTGKKKGTKRFKVKR